MGFVDDVLPDASTLGEPPPLAEVLDDLAMRFVVNCPAEEQESFERLLFQVEAAFWFYEDQYHEIWPHKFPSMKLLQFSQQLFSSCPLLKPFEKRTKEIYDAFTNYKQQIPTCGGMLLNASCTKLVSGTHIAWSLPAHPRAPSCTLAHHRAPSPTACASAGWRSPAC